MGLWAIAVGWFDPQNNVVCTSQQQTRCEPHRIRLLECFPLAAYCDCGVGVIVLNALRSCRSEGVEAFGDGWGSGGTCRVWKLEARS